MSDFIERVEAAISKRRLISPGQGILVAVSGGLDSMVLLATLRQLAGKNDWRLAVAHFNHRLRGRSSDADERLVARTASKLGLRFVRGQGDVRRLAMERKISVEMAARELRHTFLARTAMRLKMPVVALAHHADDQVELFFLRLFRGAGGEGLSGMKWQNASPANRRVTLVRPLLDRSKEELREFAQESGIVFREDATNAQVDFQRNRIRHELLPWLKKDYQPSLTRVILRQMEILGAEAQAVAGQARDAIAALRSTKHQAPSTREITKPKLRKTGASVRHRLFSDLPVAVQRRCLQIQMVEQGFTTDFELIEKVREKAERVVTIGDELAIWRDVEGRLHVRPDATGRDHRICEDDLIGHASAGQRVPTRERAGKIDTHRFQRRQKKVQLADSNSSLRGLAVVGTVVFDNVAVTWKMLPSVDGIIRAHPGPDNCEHFDADKVGLGVILRHWQPGDRFQPIGMPKSVKLQDLFTNEKVLRNVRHELIVGATARGEIFWVEGLRIGERFKLDKKTSRRLQWAWKRLE